MLWHEPIELHKVFFLSNNTLANKLLSFVIKLTSAYHNSTKKPLGKLIFTNIEIS